MTAVLFKAGDRSNVPGAQKFELELTYGASSIASAKGRNLAVQDTSAGKMTITFPQAFRRLCHFSFGWKQCAAGAVFFPVILTNNIATTGVLIVETRTEAGTATDPASGDILGLNFEVTDDLLDDSNGITVTTP